MKLHKSMVLAAMLSSAATFASSTLSVPLPDMFPKEKKDLLLTITIPSKLPDPVEVKDPPRDHSAYFNMDPFPVTYLSDEDWSMLRRMTRLTLAKNQAADLIRSKDIKTPYELGIVTHNILRNVSFYKKDYLLDNGTTREDIDFIEALLHRQESRLRSWIIDVDAYKKRLASLKKELRANKGEVRVVRVVSDTDGSTVIHLTLKENE